MSDTSTKLGERLAAVIGANRVQSDPRILSEYAIDEMLPSAIAKPASAEEAAEIVRFAIAENVSVIPSGSRSKLGIGMPPNRYDIALDMAAINQIAHYDPGDLTLSVDAGCPVVSLVPVLSPQRQFLPLPYSYGPYCTIAGTIASGVDAHLRQFYGTARDFLIGAEFIDGTGAQCKSGGRVVKNVTGYDLHKLLIGSLGTLAVITRLNFRTFPSLELSESQSEHFVAAFSNAQSAVAFRQKIASSPFTPHAVEILSPEISKIFSAIDPSAWEPPSDPLGAWFSSTRWHVVVLFHGTPELRARYATALTQLSESAGAQTSRSLPGEVPDDRTGKHGEAYTLNALVFGAVRRLRDASPAATIFKIAQLPAKLPELFSALENVAQQAGLPHALIARGVGVVYFAMLPKLADAEALAHLVRACQEVFTACAAQSATASIAWCPASLKRAVNIFGPLRPDAEAMRRLKSAFDPHNIFAPGRLVPNS